MKKVNPSKCVNCNKKLNGDFVVLNGGALRKTKGGGATLDKNLEGFFSVNNHFDSEKNYRSFILTDKTPNGQFEFYACSHKCLIKFLTSKIESLGKIDKAVKNKKFDIAPSRKIDRAGPVWVEDVITALGFKGALVTDESTVYDFIPFGSTHKQEEEYLKKISKKLGFPVKNEDYIWEIAEQLKNKLLF
jgi:hypothetical protein